MIKNRFPFITPLRFYGITIMLATTTISLATPVYSENLAVPDVSSRVKILGHPFTYRSPFAENVWDLEIFHDRLYAGFGNSANGGPGANAGPIPVVAYDLKLKTFTNEYTTSEEQINRFRQYDGRLFVPGHDPRGSPARGNLYVKDSAWHKLANIPGGVHTYDIADYDNKWFVATGGGGTTAVVTSDDQGNTWRGVLAAPIRIYGFIKFHGELFAYSELTRPVYGSYYYTIWKWNGTEFINLNVKRADLFPDQTPDNPSYIRPYRAVEFDDKLVYIGADNMSIENKNTNPQPIGLYTAADMNSGVKIPLPGGAIPYDLIVRGSVLYALICQPNSDGTWRNIVYETRNTTDWTPKFSFNSSAFARSFEENQGTFYFGLGTTIKPLLPDSGTIVSIRPDDPVVNTYTPTSEPSSPPISPGRQSADINQDGRVTVLDLSIMVANWGRNADRGDLNDDGTVNVIDLSLMMSDWTSS